VNQPGQGPFNPGSMPTPSDATGLQLSEFVGVASHLKENDFLKRFNHPFLIQMSQDLDAQENPGFGTISGNIKKILVESELTNCRLHFISKRPNNNFSMMITVGRAENNDIIIRNGKISKFHAYFNQIGDSWAVTDGNSSNGTYVRGERLVPNTRFTIIDGTDLSFSQDLNYRFVSSASMFKHVRRMRTNG
jgi:hypothetical protein